MNNLRYNLPLFTHQMGVLFLTTMVFTIVSLMLIVFGVII
jgi:hypothetical protein